MVHRSAPTLLLQNSIPISLQRFIKKSVLWMGLAMLMASLSLNPALAYPGSGIDAFESAASVTIDLSLSGGPVMKVDLAGPTMIQRGDPFDPGDGRMTIDTEIVSLALSGVSPIGPITVRESGIRRSTGQIVQQTAGTDFPADSFFDVFVEIETPLGTFVNNEPVVLQSVIDAIPPLQAEYTPPTVIGVSLYTATGVRVGVITHASHFVGQKASFSVAPAGTSGLDPADIFDIPTAPRILKADLGLTTGDNIDALAYGIDYISYNSDVRFSVDPLATGSPGSAVFAESSKVPNEAHGDEFGVTPLFPFGGSNTQFLDETGDTAPPFPLLISDDVDGLTDPPASFVDPDGDGVPDFPVYFSLSPGSPTLASIPASPADILMSVGGAAPTVFISEADLGLAAGDDVDALCLEDSTLTVLYSLAPGSPTLTANLYSPADLLGGAPIPLTSPPVQFAPAPFLGLEDTDNLNALKCLLPEVDYFSHTRAEIVIDMGVVTETVRLTGPTIIHAAVGGDGATSTNFNPEIVQTEIVSMSLVGDSSMGPVKVRVRDQSLEPFSRSVGNIVELSNNTPGVLDLPPFTPAGSADSFFDVFFEIDLGGQTFYNTAPKQIRTTITHKPPAEDEEYIGLAPVELYDGLGNPTGIFIGEVRHKPRPPLLVHDFPIVAGEIVLNTGTALETIPLAGRLSTLGFTDPQGKAEDFGQNSLDEIPTEIIQLELTGNSPTLGNILLTVRSPSGSPMLRSIGEIEETNNKTPGIMDLPPFQPGGSANGNFDVYAELMIIGSPVTSAGGGNSSGLALILHNNSPITVTGTVSEYPFAAGDLLQSQSVVDLLDETDTPSGMMIEGFNFSVIGQLLHLPLVIKQGASTQGQVPGAIMPAGPAETSMPRSLDLIQRWGAPTVGLALISAGVLFTGYRRREGAGSRSSD